MKLIVVDDDPLTCEMIVAAAQLHGHEAIATSDVNEVMSLLKGSDESPLVLTDIDLRFKGSGVQAAVGWRATFPDLQIVFMSGHSPDMIADFGERPTDTSFLQKPFDLAELIATIEAHD